MKIKILKLKPNSRFHFGKSAVDSNAALADTDTYLHSDVLFGALVSNLAKVKSEQEVDAFIKAFDTGNIRISSGFYCIEQQKSNEYLFLFPKPANATLGISLDEYQKIKAIKKVQFVTEKVLRSVPKQWDTQGYLALDRGDLEALHCNEDFQLLADKDKKRLQLFHKEIVPNVTIHKPNEEANGPFSLQVLQIADLRAAQTAIHFYFCYDMKDDKQKANFELAVNLLPCNGIGGERSSGCGKIEAVQHLSEAKIPAIFNQTDTQQVKMTLSKVIPASEKELQNFSAFSHTIRGGRKGENGHLQHLRMINEGALFQNQVIGKNATIGEKQVRYGKCLWLNIPEHFSLKNTAL